jgi:hypothetical protein
LSVLPISPAASATFSTTANVISSLPFFVLGASGLGYLWTPRGRAREFPGSPYLVFALSLIAVGAGSSFYHWSPSVGHLLWDRLPIALCLAALACALTNLYSGSRVGSVLLGPSVIVALSSVLFWYFTWTRGRADLRPYVAMQVAYAMWAGMVVFSRSGKSTGISSLRWAMVIYGVARVFELFQQQIYNALGLDLGHPLKHLLVATAAFLVLRSLVREEYGLQEEPLLRLEAASGD